MLPVIRIPFLVARRALTALQSVLRRSPAPSSSLSSSSASAPNRLSRYRYRLLGPKTLYRGARSRARFLASRVGALLRTRRGQAAASVLGLVLFLVLSAAASPAVTGVTAAEAAAAAAVRLARWNMGKEKYVAAVVANPVEGVFDPAPVREKCRDVRFQPGLVWHCAVVTGGIGNVGNMWLNCLRYALEAGATTIILPRIGARDQNQLDGDARTDGSLPLAHLYDVDYFVETWSDACPELRPVVLEDDDSENATSLLPENLPAVADAPTLAPNELGHLPRRKELVVDPRGWRTAFDAWLEGRANVSAEAPVRVVQRPAFGQWNREADPPGLAATLPRLVRFPAPVRRLAAAALWQLEHEIKRAVVADALLLPDMRAVTDPTHGNASALATSLGARRVLRGGFLGAHLRVAEDAVGRGWPGYDAQAPAYLDEAVRHGGLAIYLATGATPRSSQRFRDDAAARTGTNTGTGLAVFTKEDLLVEPAEQAALAALSWDQRAIVDLEVLVHSARFAGFARSSFSWLVALRRSTLPEAGVPAIATAAEEAPLRLHRRFAEKFRDGLSVVIGTYDAVTIQGIWP